MSSTLQMTRNESTAMDISNVPKAPNVPNASTAVVNEKPFTITRPLTLRQPYSQDQKENIMFTDDTDIELSLIMQLPEKPASTKWPSLLNFACKSEASDTLRAGEKSSGSDNMDISGIELTLHSHEPPAQTASAGNSYRDWLKQNNIGAARARRETNFSPIEISDSSIASLHDAPKTCNSVSNNRRRTCVQEMTMALEPTSTLDENKTLLHITPMKFDNFNDELTNTSNCHDVERDKCVTIIRDESIVPDDSPPNIPNISTGLNESRQLTFADENTISNTKADLSSSMESLELNNFGHRKSGLFNHRNVTKFNSTRLVDESIPTLTDTLNLNNLQALKKSNRLRQNQAYNQDQKENIIFTDDTDMELSLIMQPSEKPAPSKRPTLFNFANNKSKASVTLQAGEKTSGSDNMDISGIEPTLISHESPAQTASASNNYRDWSQQNDNRVEDADESKLSAIEISDSSIASIHNPPKIFSGISNNRRRTCVKEMSMALEPTSKSDANKTSNIMTQSILHITPMKVDESIYRLESAFKRQDKIENEWLTIIKNESIVLNDSPLDIQNASAGLEESKQLTFIEDDDEDDQICNTKLDLASSLEGSEIVVHQKSASFNHTGINVSKFSLASMNSEQLFPVKDTTASMVDESNPSITQPLNLNELKAFKKSSRLRHSNAFDTNTSTDSCPNESVAKEESLSIHKKDESPDNQISMGPIGRSSILQRRSSFGLNNEANETSFLRKSVADKPLSQLKLDFSGYDQFVGLATPQDVFKDFCNRMDQIKMKAQNWTEQRKKYETGEIENLDVLNNNSEELVSQNVEAPPWAFLYMNKIKWEE